MELSGKTIGLVGMGHIGREIARLAQGSVWLSLRSSRRRAVHRRGACLNP